MKKSELKQLIREVITELSSDTLKAAASAKYQANRGDRGEKLQQQALQKDKENKFKKIANILGVQYDPKNIEDFNAARDLTGMKIYNGIGKMQGDAFKGGITDVDTEKKEIQVMAIDKPGQKAYILFVKKNDDGKDYIVAKEGNLDSPHTQDSNTTYIAFDHKTRLKLVNAFRKMGVGINANNALVY